MTEIRLYGADDTLIYQDTRIPLPWSREMPTVALLLLPDGGHIPTIETNDLGDVDPMEMGSQGSEEQGAQGEAADPGGVLSTGIGVVSVVQESKQGRWILLGLGLSLSLCMTWLVIYRRERTIQLRPVGEPSPLKTMADEGGGVWGLQSDRQRLDVMVALARSRQGSGRILICPRPESRDALRAALQGLDMVLWSDLMRPSVAQICGFTAPLQDWGRGLIIVEGAGALEGVAGSPLASDMLCELLQRLPRPLRLPPRRAATDGHCRMHQMRRLHV